MVHIATSRKSSLAASNPSLEVDGRKRCVAKLASNTAFEEGGTTTTFNKLKQSIFTNGGIS